jgi:hypothetical protein
VPHRLPTAAPRRQFRRRGTTQVSLPPPKRPFRRIAPSVTRLADKWLEAQVGPRADRADSALVVLVLVVLVRTGRLLEVRAQVVPRRVVLAPAVQARVARADAVRAGAVRIWQRPAPILITPSNGSSNS